MNLLFRSRCSDILRGYACSSTLEKREADRRDLHLSRDEAKAKWSRRSIKRRITDDAFNREVLASMEQFQRRLDGFEARLLQVEDGLGPDEATRAKDHADKAEGCKAERIETSEQSRLEEPKIDDGWLCVNE